MHVDIWVWAITIAVVVGFFLFDFFTHVRTPHEPSLKEAAWWSIFYIALAVVFMFGLALVWDWQHAGEFIAGYTTEKALSVDNLFIFLIIMTSFKVPKIAQQKALLIGIAIALVMRFAFIIAGAAILESFAWVFYLFAAWLLYMAVKQAIDSFKDEEAEMPKWVNLVRKVIPASENYDGDKWRIVENGKKMFTPLVLVIVALGFTDLLFALDSIPAIFGITQEPYLVFMANAFALMGLRQLYFLIGGLLERLVFLDLGLAFILGFIGVKLLFHALHENDVPFINNGEPLLWIPEIPIWLSLVFIFGVLIVATVASILYTRGKEGKAEAVAAGAGPEGAVAGVESTSPKTASSSDQAAVSSRKDPDRS